MEVSHNNGEQGSRVTHAKRRGFFRVALMGVALCVILGALGVVGYRLAAARSAASPTDSTGQTDEHSSVGTKATLKQCLTLLQKNEAGNPALLDEVRRLVDEATGKGLELNQTEPSLLVVSYRRREEKVADVVVQIYQAPKAGSIEVLNPDGVVRARLGDELFGSAESLMQLLYNPVSYLGDPAAVARQQRALQAAIEGDLTLLREQTVEPLHVLVIMPSADKFLPGSLRSRVQSVVLDSELTFGEWRSQVALVTDNNETAQQVGNTVAAWREIAMTLANTYAKHSAGLPLRQSLEDSTVEVKGDWVLTAAKVPSKTVVRVTKEVAGHGGTQGCSHGFYKKPEHWPAGVTKLSMGCRVYTKAQCIALLVAPVAGDASIDLAHQLIAAKINQLVGLPATPPQLQALTDADNLLCSYGTKVPCHVAPSSPAGQQMTAFASTLDVYNNSCHSNGGTPGGGGSGGSTNTVDLCSFSYYNDATHWPAGVTKLSLGCRVYTQAQCLTLLAAASASDASVDLAHQLIAAKLNQVGGLTATTAQLDAITAGDGLFCAYPGKAPFLVPPGSPAGLQMASATATLNTYNNSCYSVPAPDQTGGKGKDKKDKTKGNNGVGNGVDPQPPGNPPVNDGSGTAPGKPGNKNNKAARD